MTKLKSLSLFLPVHNEEASLDVLLKQALEVLPQVARRFEILVIDDGSTDGSAAVAKRFAKKHTQIKLISHQGNLGYGEVLKTGIAAAQYDWIFWTDADLQFDLREIGHFVAAAATEQVVIGFREKRAEGWQRDFNTRLFKLFVDVLFRLHVRDIDCAFKLIRADQLKKLRLLSGSAFTSAEILYRLRKKRLRFKELPVSHYKRLHGQASGARLSVIARACLDALRVYAHIKLRKN